jgi:hypothetical protein
LLAWRKYPDLTWLFTFCSVPQDMEAFIKWLEEAEEEDDEE